MNMTGCQEQSCTLAGVCMCDKDRFNVPFYVKDSDCDRCHAVHWSAACRASEVLYSCSFEIEMRECKDNSSLLQFEFH